MRTYRCGRIGLYTSRTVGTWDFVPHRVVDNMSFRTHKSCMNIKLWSHRVADRELRTHQTVSLRVVDTSACGHIELRTRRVVGTRKL